MVIEMEDNATDNQRQNVADRVRELGFSPSSGPRKSAIKIPDASGVGFDARAFERLPGVRRVITAQVLF